MASKKQSDVSSEGNFAHDPQRASEAGKKGGQHPHSGSQHQAEDSKLGGAQRGSSNVANGPDKASQAGRKGGRALAQRQVATESALFARPGFRIDHNQRTMTAVEERAADEPPRSPQTNQRELQ